MSLKKLPPDDIAKLRIVALEHQIQVLRSCFLLLIQKLDAKQLASIAEIQSLADSYAFDGIGGESLSKSQRQVCQDIANDLDYAVIPLPLPRLIDLEPPQPNHISLKEALSSFQT